MHLLIFKQLGLVTILFTFLLDEDYWEDYSYKYFPNSKFTWKAMIIKKLTTSLSKKVINILTSLSKPQK